LLGVATVRADTSSDVDTVRQRLYDSLLKLPDSVRDRVHEPAAEALASMHADGSWPDQIYTDTDRNNWKCLQHLPRTFDMARAARSPGTSPAESKRYLDASTRALSYWLKVDPHNTNWWHNEIGVPQLVGWTLVLLGDDAPPEIKSRGIEVMRRSKWDKWTGQNLVWGCGIQIMRGCLEHDAVECQQGFRRMWDEVRIVTDYGDGIQPDFSFHQHGPLLYSGGYGEAFTADTTRFLVLARDTPFSIPPEKLRILQSYVLDGQQWMLRGRQWDYGVEGRELVRKGKDAGGVVPAIDALATLPGDRAAEMAAFAKRLHDDPAAPPLSGNRHFWCSDYMVHERPGYFTSARMYSARTLNTDGFINGENKKSHHLADGATYIFLTGREYREIFPVWDWRRIPGTTIEQNTPLDPKKVNHKGKTTFVGGVSDGMYGCATMDLASGELTAKKSWFYFDDEFVCLGTDIRCDSANPVFTSLTQCLLNGPVRASTQQDDVSRGDRTLAGARWVWHDSVGYVFPTPTDVHLRNDGQTGSWREINPLSDEPITKDVFSLWLDHGSHASGASYAYIVVPAVDAVKTGEIAAKLPLEILSNTSAVQAVRDPGLELTEAVFRESGSIRSGEIMISVDRPCAILMKVDGTKARLAVSNPENKPATMTVTFAGKPEARETVELPGGLDAGRSVVRTVSLP
jgi:chondroitin AC lyase